MDIAELEQAQIGEAAELTAAFRVELKRLRGIDARPDPVAGARELREYLDSGFPVYAARVEGRLAGYAVCRVDAPTVWLESIYVRPECRRRGVATALLRRAEALAAGYGETTVFNYVHPNNDAMIAFLRRHGYTVLNLIEIRKPYAGERPAMRISVGAHEFDY